MKPRPAFTGPCAHLPLAPGVILSKWVRPISLSPYGRVCFVAHITAYPFPAGNSGLSHSADTYIAMSLYQNGQKIYDFTYPNTPDWAWPSDTIGIQSVAFRKLKGTRFTDVIAIGIENSANGPPVYVPLVFIASDHGFTFDEPLSESDTIFGISSMPALLRAIAKVGIAPPVE